MIHATFYLQESAGSTDNGKYLSLVQQKILGGEIVDMIRGKYD